MAIVLAVLGAATTIGVWTTLTALLFHFAPAGGDEGMSWLLLLPAWVLFAHIWTALFLVAWHLRKSIPSFHYGRAALRAAGWSLAATLTAACAFALWGQTAQGADAFVTGLRWAPWWVATMAVWAAIAGSGLLARAMVGRRTRARTAGLPYLGAIAVAVLVWLAVLDILSLPARTCQGECWGLMEGGIAMIPLLGLWMFLFTTGAAAVSAAAWFRTGEA